MRARSAIQVDDDVIIQGSTGKNGIVVAVNEKTKKADVFVPELDQTYTYRFHDLQVVEFEDEKKYEDYVRIFEEEANDW